MREGTAVADATVTDATDADVTVTDAAETAVTDTAVAVADTAVADAESRLKEISHACAKANKLLLNQVIQSKRICPGGRMVNAATR
ncbi:hypothetical protein BDDG_12941 [Blastomyces dermatitidis ATCC 18188]|uniref:Uncharacterized protein n=1 Tax=Ajellomyces dermatitidis (strain ATCC 18188 / CBS 674.68) TaxID=653446 RepID=A0A0J9EU04_AJEDA|nr:hypothetical protein BDDG_12941 [Blastomyces dermatitidis ATCC 18188]